MGKSAISVYLLVILWFLFYLSTIRVDKFLKKRLKFLLTNLKFNFLTAQSFLAIMVSPTGVEPVSSP